MRARLSRRDFMLAMGAVGLAACTDAGQAATFDLGGSRRLRILNWDAYIDGDDVDDANDDLFYDGGTLADLRLLDQPLDVTYDPRYEDNYGGFDIVIDEAINRSPSTYDIVVPTNWRAAEMIARDWATPLPIEEIPNHVNIDPAFLTNAWDRGCRFQMPWQAGITGIAYDPAATGRELTSINDLFDPALRGRVGLIGEMREAVGLAMLANGDDPSRPTADAAGAGLGRIEEAAAAGQVGAFVFEDGGPKVAAGELSATMAWSGDVVQLQADRPDIEFIVPEEGAIQWFDTMVIPSTAANIAAAGRFMNFVYDPANAARITEWVQYISPVLGVQDELRARGGAAAELADSPILFPDAETRSRLFTWGRLAQADEDQLDEAYAALVEAT